MKYRIVVENVNKAHEAQVQSYRLHPDKQQRMKEAPKRPKGTVHTEAESDCPLGKPNCRNCGDPVHQEACRAAGHCLQCGTDHGIAPESVLKAKGYRLEPA